MANCSRLEEIANTTRPQMLAKNNYTDSNSYGPSHPDATQQTIPSDPDNKKGRGTGIKYDTQNGGNFYDINGRSEFYGSGRQGIFMVNKYNPNNIYSCNI